MIKRLLIILIIAVSSFNTLSQTRQDSTVLADRDIKALLSAFDEWKVLHAENPVLRQRVVLLESKIAVKDSIIVNLDQVVGMNGLIIQDYILNEKNLLRQRSNLEGEVKRLNKAVKRQKRKTFFTSLAGAVGIAGAAILLLK